MIIKVPPRQKTPSANIFVEYINKKTPSTANDATIILLPGGPGADHSVYKNQIERLINWANVIMFDPRGCGASAITTPDEYHMDVYIDDVEAIRKHFHLKHTIILGTSYGSMAAQGYAIRYSINLELLILIAGAPSYEFLNSAKTYLELFGSIEQKNMFQRLLNGSFTSDTDFQEYFRVMAPLYSVKIRKKIESTGKERKFRFTGRNTQYSHAAANAGFGINGFLKTFDWRPQLKEIQCPVRILAGEEDWINNLEQAAEIKKHIANCELKIIKSTGHFIWTDDQKSYFSELDLILKNHLTHSTA